MIIETREHRKVAIHNIHMKLKQIEDLIDETTSDRQLEEYDRQMNDLLATLFMISDKHWFKKWE